MLLVRQQGTMLCSMKMPLVDVLHSFSPLSNTMIDDSSLSITVESSMGGLTHDIVCSTTTDNFDEDYIAIVFYLCDF